MKKNRKLFFCFTEKFLRFFIRKVSILLFIFLLPAPVIIKAQNNAGNETETNLKTAAASYFDQGDLIDAYPIYSQLLSLYPRDPTYNYRFGACMLYANANKKKAVKYIEYALKQPAVENLAYYYLGRSFHLNYEFTKAIRAYEKFEQGASSGELKKYPVKHLIEMCQNGKQLLATSEELDVLRKKQLNLSDYFEAYNMHSNGGILIAEPDEFKTKLDKKKKVANLMYLTPDKSEAFFSSYGSNEDNGKDIYVIKRKPDGTWGAPENLGNVINTVYDEDYPVYDAPRHTLYFSSKGHNSMGGYDIFRSVYKESSKTWSEPENLDFPINTPDDDILLVPDTSGKTAFFASTRSSPQGKIDVYRIALHLHPPESIVVAGTVYKAGGETPEFSIITVRDSATNKVIAVDTTSAEDGGYSFSLPKNGKYIFTVQDSTHKGQSQAVVLAAEEAQVAIEDNIQFNSSGALQIKNNPAESAKDSDSELAIQYMQNKAQMDVNVDTNSIQSILAQNTPDNSNTSAATSSSAINNSQNVETGSSNLLPVNTDNNSNIASTNAVQNNVNVSETTGSDSVKAIQLKQDEQALNDKASKATDYASDKMDQAQEFREQANAASISGGVNSDSVALYSDKSNAAAEKGMEAYQLAAEYKNEAAAKQMEINRMGNANSPGNTAMNNSNINNVSTANVTSGDLIRQQAQQVKEDSAEIVNTNSELNEEVSGLQQKSEEFVAQAGQTTDSQQRVALLQQADDLSKSKAEKQEEIKENNVDLEQLHDENAWLNTKAQKADSVSIASANGGNNTNELNPASQSALQQEIDTYAANNPTDSTSNVAFSNNNDGSSITTDNNENPNPSVKNGRTSKVRHSRYFYHKKNESQSPQAGNIVAANNGNPNSGTPPGNDSAINNGQNISTGNTINTAAGNSAPGNNANANANQNTPTGINNSPAVNNSGINNSSSVAVSNNTGENNHPDSSVYYRTPDNAFLDSIVQKSPLVTNTFSNPASPDNFSSNSSGSGASSITVVQYTDTVSVVLEEKSKKYFAVATSLSDTVKKIRAEAQAEQDKNKSATLYAKADSVDALVFQLTLKGDEIIAEANARQYSANKNQIKNITASTANIHSDKITRAQNRLKNARYSYVKSSSEKDSAKNSPAPARKRIYIELEKKDLANAILKQEDAVYLFFQADSVHNANTANASNSGTAPLNFPDFLKTQGKETVNASNSFSADNSGISNTAAIQNTSSEKAETNQNTVNVQQANPVSPSESAASTSSNNITTPSSTNNINSSSTDIGVTDNASHPENSQPVSLTETATIFNDIHKSAYSASRPIPMEPPLPEGVAFGVQVGAFRNSIPPGLFKGFKPIIGLKAPEGYTRYIAGLFMSFDTAKDIEVKIRNLGYPGAFIVAYYNGRRIPIKEALEKLGIGTLPVASYENSQTTSGRANPESFNSSVSPGDNKAVTISGNTLAPSKNELIETKRRNRKAIKDTVPPVAISIGDIKGLFYTVQVGSFSRHKGFARLRKIKHLYYWNDANGTVKYNSGTYSSVADARAARDIIVDNTSVKDAFVTAYYNNQRITLAQARNLLGNGEAPINTASKISISPVNKSAYAANSYEEIESSSFVIASRTKVIFTVRVASFAGQPPADTLNKLLSYANEGIEPCKEKSGIIAYYSGKFPDYAEASVLQQKFFKDGFRQAAIAAYYQGSEISLQEAQSITNK